MTALFHIDSRNVADDGDELGIQTRFRARMKMLAPTVRIVATPNGGKRTAWEGMKAKREGLQKGWPDVTLYWSNGRDHNAIPGTALIEFKDRGGSCSPEQTDCLNWLTRAGFACGVFRSVETAVAFARNAGAPFLFGEEAA